MFRKIVSKLFLTLALLLTATGAKAADYVLAYRANNGTVYYLARNGTTGVQRVTAFDPTTCVWSCASNANGTGDGTLSNSNTYGYLYQMVNNTRYFLSAGANALTLATTASANDRSYTRWRTNGSYVYNAYRNNTSYYINLANDVARATSSSGTCARPCEYTDGNSSSSSTTSLSVPTITPATASLDYNEGNTFTASATATTTTTTVPAHKTFTVNGNTYYYYDGTIYTSTNGFTQQATTNPDITYTWTLSGAANSYLSPTSGTGASITITHSPQTPSDVSSTLSVTASAAGQTQTSTSNATVTAKASTVDPTSVNITSTNPTTLYVGNTGNITYSLSPTPCYNNVTFTSANPSIATVSSTGEVTAVAVGQTTISVKAYKYSAPTQYVEATVTVNVRNVCDTPTITFAQIGDGSTANVTITSTAGADIYYTTDGSEPTTSSTLYTGAFTVNEGDEIKAIAVMTGNANWDNSATAAVEYHACTTDEPVISYVASGSSATVTITAEPGATIYYTTNGSDPTTSSASETTSVTLSGVSSGTTVKAFAQNGSCQASAIVTREIITSGVGGDVVTLYDYEDHNWSYYSDASLPAQLRSLNPADVKITYYGNGTTTVATSNDANPGNTFTASTNDAVKVGIDADASTFVYYKTLERTDGSTAASVDAATGRCAYTTIPNPFSVRPTYGTDATTKYRGFYTWRIKSVSGGTIYNAATGGTVIAVGGTIDAETEVYFAPTSEYGMEVELEALWARAYVGGGYQSSVGYERNFVIGGAAVNYPATYSAIYPNGTTNGTTAATTVTGTYDPGAARTLSYDTKFEYINLTGNRTYTANNHNLCFGRGISTANNAGSVQGINGGVTDLNYMLRVESGQFSAFSFVRSGTNTTVSGRYLVKAIMGCDYDRATNTNDKLSVSASSTLFYANTVGFTGSSNKDQKTFDCVFKSGSYQKNYWSEATQNQNAQTAYQQLAYLGQNTAQGNTYPGVRCVMVEGGEFSGMCGGRGVSSNSNNSTYMTPEVITFDLCIKGGLFHGAVYGGAADNPSIGSRRILVTGGEIRSWIAGGCNGTGSVQNGTGITDGNSYIYVGGNALVGGDDAMLINGTNGGQVFGAGRGLAGRSSSINYSHVAIADEAVISNNNNDGNNPVGGNVYGGSYNGTIANESNVYILGGKVEGSVFGGSYGNGTTGDIPAANVTMTGGLVTNGVYGGSNSTGTVGNVTMQIDGGQVGTSSANANIHGGGLGSPTRVSGNVDLTLGVLGQTEPGVTVYGDVYGGSAFGNVNTNTSNHTNVTLNKGLIYGNAYGGGLGDASTPAYVNGNVTVILDGAAFHTSYETDSSGKDVPVTGSVFGCNNINGTPLGTVTVHVKSTTPEDGGSHQLGRYEVQGVYGGGNQAAYNPTYTLGTNEKYKTNVIVEGCDKTSIEYVYGGGNAAAVPGTSVQIMGSFEIDWVFGGGNGRDMVKSGNTWIANTGADVGVNNQTAYLASAPNYNQGLYTNGTRTTNVEIIGGTIHHAFGGSNTLGYIADEARIVLGDQDYSDSGCTIQVDEVYAAGNEAELYADAVMEMKCIDGVKALYGGSRLADVKKDVVMNIVGGTYEKVFGGNNLGGKVMGSITINIEQTGCLPIIIGELYGGGNEADYSVYGYNNDNSIKTSGEQLYENPVINIKSAKSIGTVYGGGLKADVAGSPTININMSEGWVNGQYSVAGSPYNTGGVKKFLKDITGETNIGSIGAVFGGGNQGQIIGDTKVNVGTQPTVTLVSVTASDLPSGESSLVRPVVGANITGNVFGGGNEADVTGSASVVVGKE